MTICVVCGNNNPEGNRFCQECGNPMPVAEPEVKESQSLTTNDVSEQTTISRSQPTKQKMTTKKKVLVSSILTIIVLLLGAHLFIKNSIDPYKQLSEANRAFVAKDTGAFLSYFSINNDVIVDEESFYQFMKEEDWTDSISPSIKKMIQQVEDGQYSKPLEDSNGNNLISVVDEKYLWFYKKVKIHLEPINVVATTSVPTATVNFGDESSATVTSEESTLGKFTPGTHNFKVLLKDDFSEQTVPVDEDIIGDGDNKLEISFNFDEQTVQFSSDYPEAIVFINGKSTKKTAEELTLYTLPLDGSVKVHAEIDGKKSETVKVSETDIHIPFEDVQQKIKDEELKAEQEQAIAEFEAYYEEDAKDLFHQFRSDYYSAVQYGDFSYVSDYFVDGSLKNDYRDFVFDHNEFEFTYNYDFLSNEISSISAVNETTFNLYSYEVFEFFTSTNENYHYERQKKYTLKLVDDELKITGLEDSAPVSKVRIN